VVQRRFFGGAAVEVPSSLVSPPAWEELDRQLAELTPEDEAAGLEETRSGRGQLRVDVSKVRLFDLEDASKVRVKLYRDHAAWCPYCEKVQLALEEKQVPYSISKINMNCYGDKPFDFLAKNPMGLLPVAEVDGQLVTDSNSILDVVEASFPEKRPLVPPGQEAEVSQLLRLERALFGAWFTWLRSQGNDVRNREGFLQVMEMVEDRLSVHEGPFFLGQEVTMPECHFASFLERMAASLAYFKGFKLRQHPRFPRLEQWFKAMEARSSYTALAGDFYTHAHDLPPQVGGCAFNDQSDECREILDGADWRLPLTVDVPPTPLEPLLLNTSAEAEIARREAARKLISNHKAVVGFCLRAKGRGGFPPVGAPLSDPRAAPSGDGELSAAVDEALRGVAAHLLQGGGQPIAPKELGPAAYRRREELEACLGYLCARVGVPRDMSFPAARQLRAHLGSYIEAAAKPVNAA